MSHTRRSELCEKLHDALDDIFESVGINEDRVPEYGSVIVEVKFENSKPTIRITERSIERKM